MKKKVAVVFSLVCAIAIVLTVLSSAQAKTVTDDTELSLWTVRRGDTLWNIAAKNRGNTEIRKYIYQIQQLNDIGSTIYPGQKLQLPPGK